MNNVLVVEDNESNVQGAIMAITEIGKWCLIARNMKEAEKFLTGEYSSVEWECVITDMNFPGGSGIEVGEICKNKGIPFVFVTAVGEVKEGIHIHSEAVKILNADEECIQMFPEWMKTKEIWKKAYDYAVGNR